MLWLLNLPRESDTPMFNCGDVIHVTVHGGFFVEVEHIQAGRSWDGTVKVWHVLARPMFGHTLVCRLTEFYRQSLKAQGLNKVEAALHVAEFAKRAMRIAKETERDGGALKGLCYLVEENK